MPPTAVHFNGSVNLSDAETVMREISTRIPSGVRRMTDGETGERGYWILYQIKKFMAMPEFEAVSTGQAYESSDDAPAMPQLRLVQGASADTIRWPNLGYADEYVASFAVFDQLQRNGTIPSDVRFQLQYPTPLASMAGTVVPEDLQAVSNAYERALFADVDNVLTALPHDRIALQWDVAVEFGLLEGGFGIDPVPLEDVVPGLLRCVDHIPDDVPVGMHLCYGDYGHQHFKQPESIGLQVRLVNAVNEGARRPLSFVSFTVPQDRSDAGYFAPVSDLRAGGETELYFALVPYHPERQASGVTEEQIGHVDEALAGSRTGSRSWGICTECGMGRVDREDVPALLDLHRTILEGQPQPA